MEQRMTVIFKISTATKEAGWPIHGKIVLVSEDGTNESCPPFFSREAVREFVGFLLQQEAIGQVQATMLCSTVDRATLPEKLTQWDRLFHSTRTLELAMRSFLLLAGLVPAEDGSGPARFEVCRNGACGLACDGFPRHGRLFAANMALPLCIVFSATGAKVRLEDAVEVGLIDDGEERKKIRRQIAMAMLLDTDEACRADAFNHPQYGGHSFAELSLVLSVILGVRDPVEATHFKMCSEHDSSPHTHFFFNGGQNTIPIANGFDADFFLKSAISQGIIDPSERNALRQQFNTLGLPEGSAEESLCLKIAAAEELAEQHMLDI